MERDNPTEKRVRDLEEEVAGLKIVIEEMREALVSEFSPINCPHLPHLTRTEQLVLSVLIRRLRASKEQIHTWAFSDRLDPPEIKIIDVFIMKLRRKLAPLGVEIETIYGQGYVLPPASRAIILGEPPAKDVAHATEVAA